MESPYKIHVDFLKTNNIFKDIENPNLTIFWENLYNNNCYILEIICKLINDLNIIDFKIIKLCCILEVIVYCTKLYLLENNDNSVELMILNIVSFSLSQLIELFDGKIINELIKKLNLVNYVKCLLPNNITNICSKKVFKIYYRELMIMVIKLVLEYSNLNINKTKYYFYKYFNEKYLNV